MIPIIKVWCLPKVGQRQLNKLFRSIVAAVESVTELGLKGSDSMTILFPQDMMNYGLGTVIIIEITLPKKPGQTAKVRQLLAESLGTTLKGHFPKAVVQCMIHQFDPKQGLWTSPRRRRLKLISAGS